MFHFVYQELARYPNIKASGDWHIQVTICQTPIMLPNSLSYILWKAPQTPMPQLLPPASAVEVIESEPSFCLCVCLSICVWTLSQPTCLTYTDTLFQKKRNFSSWIFPRAQGHGHVTWGREKSAYQFSKQFLKKMHPKIWNGSLPILQRLSTCVKHFLANLG